MMPSSSSAYDVAVGLHASAADELIGQLFKAKSSLFKGSESFPNPIGEGKATMDWWAPESPKIDLSSSPSLSLGEGFRKDRQRLTALGATVHEIDALAAETTSQSSFSIDGPVDAQLTLGSNKGEVQHLTCKIHVQASINDQGAAAFSVTSIDLTGFDDPGTEGIIKQHIVPALKDRANEFLAGVRLPPLKLPGISIAAPVVYVQSEYLVLAAPLKGSGGGNPLSSIPTASHTFVALSKQGYTTVVQANASSYLQKHPLSKSGSKGSKGFDVHYDAALSFGGLKITPEGKNVHLEAPLTGSAHAGFKLFGKNIGVGYDALAVPTPSGTFTVVVHDQTLRITIASLHAFTVLLTPSGSIGSKIVSGILAPVIQSLAAVLTPLATTVVKGLSFDIFTLPPIAISVEGVSATARISKGAVQQFEAGLVFEGDVAVSISSSSTQRPVRPRAHLDHESEPDPDERAHASQPPFTLRDVLYQGAQTGQRVDGGLYFFGVYEDFGNGTIDSLTDTSLTCHGDFNVDFTYQGQHIKGKGQFTAGIEWQSDKQNWRLNLQTTGDWTEKWTGSIGASMQDGKPVLEGLVDIGFPIHIKIQFGRKSGDDGALYAQAYSTLQAPTQETLPTAYVKFAPTQAGVRT